MAVVLYRSTDPAAVQLDGQAGSLVAVLDSVLVAAGWSIAFTTTNIRAYRQPAALDSISHQVNNVRLANHALA